MNSRIKLSARAAMCGSYSRVLPAVTALLLLTVIFSLCNAVMNRYIAVSESVLLAVSVITILLAVIFCAPLRLYLQIKFLMLARGVRRNGIIEMGFSDILKAVELTVRLFFLKMFWLSVFEVLPVSAGLAFIFHNYNNAVSLRAAYAVLAGVSALAVIGLIFYCIFVQRYSKAWFFLGCYADFSAGDALKESVRKTKNILAEIFIFKLSFLPWFLLCIGILPAFYVIPYYKQSVTCYYLSR